MDDSNERKCTDNSIRAEQTPTVSMSYIMVVAVGKLFGESESVHWTGTSLMFLH